MSLPSNDFETLAVHAGVEPDPVAGAVMTPIYQVSTFAQAAPGKHKGYEYARTDNPTRTALQSCLAALENGEKALAFSSGLAAIDAVLNTLKQGDHVIAGDDLYGGTYRIFSRVAANRGIEFSFIKLDSSATVEAAIKPNTRLIWFETPTNPLLSVVDLRMIAALGAKHGVLTAVDNTFMSPYFQRPLELGLDIVMHSMTKYLNGHSDVVMGCLVMRKQELYEKLKFLQNSLGGVPAPFDCFLALRGIKTLAIRMQRHEENAAAVAKWLEGHSKVERVLYPGLPSHPQHALAASQSSGHSGMITFFIKGGLDESAQFLSSLKLFTLAESLGGVESLAEHPAIMTHASVPPEVRREIGLTDNLVRLSIGIESQRDIIADLDQALSRV